ncbi:hypothetical protein GCM10011490_00160 [Pseudoclavibacter endophyticus]|nr:hypothetical protein GCM10011490_00160 [Pseudoclavibacter endophyticus]
MAVVTARAVAASVTRGAVAAAAATAVVAGVLPLTLWPVLGPPLGPSRKSQQLADLGVRQLARLTGAQRAEMQGAEAAAHELEHGVPDVVEHAAHDAVAARVQRELDERGGVARLVGVDEGPIGLDEAVLELEAFEQLLQRLRQHAPAHLRHVGLLDAV